MLFPNHKLYLRRDVEIIADNAARELIAGRDWPASPQPLPRTGEPRGRVAGGSVLRAVRLAVSPQSILVTWTKGFKCSSVEGRDVVSMLRKSIKKRGVRGWVGVPPPGCWDGALQALHRGSPWQQRCFGLGWLL